MLPRRVRECNIKGKGTKLKEGKVADVLARSGLSRREQG
jgi:hypothetical protein